MFDDLLQISENTINLDLVKFREIGQYVENQDKLLEYITQTNLKILETYPVFNYRFSVKSVSAIDLQHIIYLSRFCLQVQKDFSDKFGDMYVEDMNDFTKFFFTLFLSLLEPSTLAKIHFV
jgi:hypothetical protein